MIDRQHGHIVIECDSCDEVFDSGTDDFAEAWGAAKRDGDALQYVKDQTEAVCLKAVECDGDALQYVLSLDLFVSLAAKLKISINVPKKWGDRSMTRSLCE